jgi:hypothetical protein
MSIHLLKRYQIVNISRVQLKQKDTGEQFVIRVASLN